MKRTLSMSVAVLAFLSSGPWVTNQAPAAANVRLPSVDKESSGSVAIKNIYGGTGHMKFILRGHTGGEYPYHHFDISTSPSPAEGAWIGPIPAKVTNGIAHAATTRSAIDERATYVRLCVADKPNKQAFACSPWESLQQSMPRTDNEDGERLWMNDRASGRVRHMGKSGDEQIMIFRGFSSDDNFGGYHFDYSDNPASEKSHLVTISNNTGRAFSASKTIPDDGNHESSMYARICARKHTAKTDSCSPWAMLTER